MQNALMRGDKAMADRLKRARVRAGYENASDAAVAMEIPYPTYAQHENGNGGFARRAGNYARFFKVRTDWLLTGRGPISGEPVVEIFQLIPEAKKPDGMNYLRFLAGLPPEKDG